MFGFWCVRAVNEKGLLVFDRGNKRFGDVTISVNDIFEDVGFLGFIGDESLEAGFLEICSICVPKVLEISQSGGMCIWSFDLFQEWGEGVFFFKGAD
jgi:hypothetical protein